MDTLINERIDPNILMEFERKYKQEEAMGNVNPTTKFEYAWCLVRTPYINDWKTGYTFLQELYEKGDDLAKRDYLFYMSIAQFKLKNYDEALKYCKAILHVQPENHQVIELKEHIEKKVRNEGLFGMAIVGGASVVLGIGAAIVGGILAARRK